MKNYKTIVPIALIVLLLLSMYMLYDSRKTQEEEYNRLIAEARRYTEKDIPVDAGKSYLAAYELRPSADLALEIYQAYLTLGNQRTVERWAESALEEYPKDIRFYDAYIEYCYDNQKYERCYEWAQTYRNRGLQSEKIEAILNEIAYAFYFGDSYDEVGVFSNGLCAVSDGENKWGYVNQRGESAGGGEYKKLGAHSSDSLAPAIDKLDDAYFVDKEGNKKEIVENVEQVVELGYISNGVFPLYDGTSWGFYNLDGKHLFGEYDEACALANGVAAVRKGDKWTVVNGSGEKVLQGEFYDVIRDGKTVACRNDRLFVETADGYRMVDTAGTKYGEPYNSAVLFNDETYAAVQVGALWGFVDAAGKMVIEPQYEGARSFSNGYAAVMVGDRWGFIDLKNNMVIEPQFLDAGDFTSSGTVMIKRSRGWTLLTLYAPEYLG